MERKHEKRLVGCDELARIIEQFGEQERELELDLTPKMRVAALWDFLQQYMDTGTTNRNCSYTNHRKRPPSYNGGVPISENITYRK